jgi:hypothetical protein
VLVNGIALTVFNTTYSGVGIAIGVKPVFTGGCSNLGFQDLGSTISTFPKPWFALGCIASTNPASMGAQIEVVLVKTGPFLPE